MSKYLSNRENIVDILSTAFYGSFWASASTPKEFRDKYKDGFEDRESRWAQILLDGGYINVEDVEEEETYKLTLEMLKKAWTNEEDNEGIARVKADILNESYDLYDADAIIQTAIFGEVVYG